jgi:SseB protein C-terminal domain
VREQCVNNMITTFQIPAGSEVRFGRPALPLPAELRDKIARGLSSISEIVEAHLPMCYVPSTMQEPTHVLVVVLERKTDIDSALPTITKLIGAVMPTGKHLDVLPLTTGNSLIDSIRAANCQLSITARS